MKKKLLLVVSIVALLVCLFAITVSAETVLKPQDTNAYGELSFFDESITVGRTDTANGFTPYLADGTSYARVVIGDGTTFYTFPTYYMMEKNPYESGPALWQYNFTSLNSAMESATGTNPGWSEANVYRLEFPTSLKYVTGSGRQYVQGYSNLIELTLAPNMTTVSTNQNCLFRYNPKLEVINNIDTFVFKKGCLTDAFYNNASLTSLTLCYSPDVVATGTNVFRGCTALTSVNFVEAFPNVTEIGNYAFNNCTNLKSISSNGQEYAFALQEGITKIGQESFSYCKAVKYISIPSSVTYLGPTAFRTCTALEFVDFNDNQNDIDFNNWGQFYECSALEAVSMPDNVDVIENRVFSKCTNLQAVYLPSSTVSINSNGYGDSSAFSFCNNMYFVNEAFEVRGEDGLFLGDSFKMPDRPDVYYFPSGLTNIFQRDSGVGFAQCYNLNPVLVFPETLQQFWINDGVLYECGAKGATFTVVFLGDMTNLRLGMRENRAKGVSYVFANPADTDLSCVNVIDTSPSYTPNLNGEEFIYFCKSGEGFKLYNLGGASDASQYTNDNTTLEAMEKHLRSPRKDAHEDATCTSAAGSFTYCFCGKELSFVADEGSVALDHVYDNLTGKYYPVVNEVADYSKNAIHQYLCSRCEENVEKEEPETALFVKYGYSVSETDSTFLTYSMYANAELISAYAQYKNVAISYGLVVSASPDGTPLSFENDELVSDANTVKIDVFGTNYNKLTVKVSNIGTANLHCNGYVTVGTDVVYINHKTVDKVATEVTHASVLEMLQSEGSDEEEA